LETDWSDPTETDLRYFVYGNYIDEAILMVDAATAADHYYVHDHLSSPVALIASDGTIEERYEYDTYGNLIRFDPNFTPWSGTPAGNPYFFTGRRLDELDSGDLPLMYYRTRYYDTETARFLQQDPIGYANGMNLYEYVGSNPASRIDPMGLDWERGDRSWGTPRADYVVTNSTEVIWDLAVKIKLNPLEFKNWVKLSVGDSTIRTSNGPKKLEDLTLHDKICVGEKVSVPNTAYVVKGDVSGAFSEWFNIVNISLTIELYDVVAHYMSKGYNVVGPTRSTTSEINKQFMSYDIIAWAAAGHGYGRGGFNLSEKTFGGVPMVYRASNAKAVLNHQLAEVILLACWGGEIYEDSVGWRDIVAPNGILRASAIDISYFTNWEDLPVQAGMYKP